MRKPHQRLGKLKAEMTGTPLALAVTTNTPADMTSSELLARIEGNSSGLQQQADIMRRLSAQLQGMVAGQPTAIATAIQANTDKVLEAVTLLLQHQADVASASTVALSQAFTASVTQARVDLHNEILGAAGPLLTLITQLQAEDAAEQGVHQQFATQLGSLLQTLTTLQHTVASQNTAWQAALDVQKGRVDALENVTVPALRSATTTVATAAAAATSTANAALAAQTALTGRFRAARIPTPQMPLATTVTIPVTWATPFADANYTINQPAFVGAALAKLKPVVTAWTAAGCTVTVENILGLNLAVGAGTLHISAIHD